MSDSDFIYCSVKGCGMNSIVVVNEKRAYCKGCFDDFQKLMNQYEYSIRFLHPKDLE